MLDRLAIIATVTALPSLAMAQTDAPFTLPDLPYAADALAPAISAETMELHHGKHHKAYVDNLNKAVAADANAQGKTLEDLVANAGTYAPAIRNNAGGHWNHKFFWESMAPEGERDEMSEPLSQAVTAVYGSPEEFRKAFEKAGADRFGSGWVWLIVNDQDQLEITSTPNQDNPLMDVADEKGAVLLAADVWEHAYYLKYQNRRVDYLKAFWSVVNWNKVNELYEAAKG